MDIRSSARVALLSEPTGKRLWLKPRVTVLEPGDFPREAREEIARKLRDRMAGA